MYTVDGRQIRHQLTPEDVAAAEGNDITFSACVHKKRNMGNFTLIILRTGRYIFQSVYIPDKCNGDFDTLTEGAYVTIWGTVKKEERAVNGYEITLSSFKILSLPKEEYPLNVSANHLDCSVETSMEHRNAALRHIEERAVFKILEGVVSGFRNFMLNETFTEIHTPKIVSQNAEGGTNIFKLKYFGNNAYLSQSPQLYKQQCIAFFDRVFEVGHAYRAEKHNSTRHLNEFISLDFEMAYIDGIHDIMDTETALIKYIFGYIKKHYTYELDLLNISLPEIKSIPIISFNEAMDILNKKQNQHDLDPTDESKLYKWSEENYGSDFVFVEHFPKRKRPFYIMNSKDNPELTESFDLLFRGVEISSGGQRIHDHDEQVEKLKELKIDPYKFSSYLDAHRYGLPPHGGAAIGLERIVMKLLRLDNIRQASLFPRDLHHIEP